MELDINGAKILFTLPIDLPVLGPLRISETMVVSWIVMILITGFCIWLTHDLKEENISKRQALAEMLVEMANKFVVGNMGEKFRYMIPFVAALFATSVVSNLISLVGLRSPTSDLSTEAAWAVVVFIMITAQKIKTSGFGGYLKGFTHRHVLDPGNERGHHLLFPDSRIHARPALLPLRKHPCHRQRRPVAAGRTRPHRSPPLHLSPAPYPEHRIRQYLRPFAAPAGYSHRIPDDDAHRHDHRGYTENGGHRARHQSAHHSADDRQPLHLQLQADDMGKHHPGMDRLHRRSLHQLSAQRAIGCHHHLHQHRGIRTRQNRPGHQEKDAR